ncbi:MAG: hypothetical protein H0W72_07450 [Planctomycetes bacterium]|nr:hypothetical protein [Planctomycetota bacterium]
MPTYALAASSIRLDATPILAAVGSGLALEADPTGCGSFIRIVSAKPSQDLEFQLGSVAGLRRFTCCHRYEPFWMKPVAGTALAEVPAETQYLLADLGDGRCLLVVPLFGEHMRFALEGRGEHLFLVGETLDPATTVTSELAAFIAVGQDPYELIPRAAAAVTARLGCGRLRRDKRLPAFVDVFGWCTWDAFYQEVSHDKVRQGLESFARIGIRPRSLILDDGWQSERTVADGSRRLTAFAANAKFPGDLRPTVTMAKGEFGIETFLVWHAVVGYWGGVDGDALPGYGVREVQRHFGAGIGRHTPVIPDWWKHPVTLVAKEHVARFYHDYHRHIRAQGVDGVKIDNQAQIESCADGSGGRVALTRAYREAIEGAGAVHFLDTVINCMSSSTETFYAAATTNLLRTSTDFWPNKPESHGGHLATNAQVSAWFSEFIHPDWDMFQSGHAMGAYHAAGRAVSGAPIYVSDKPDQHNTAVLRTLVCSDGSVLRCRDIGRPTLDCLFHDCTREDVLLKIFNCNHNGSGVIGVFNARYHEQERERKSIGGHVVPEHVVGLVGDTFAVYTHAGRSFSRRARGEKVSITIGELTWEVVTVVPIERGVAVVGLTDKLNSAGAVLDPRWEGETYVFGLQDGGNLLIACDEAPKRLLVDGAALAFAYDADQRTATATVAPGRHQVRLER